LQACGLTAAGAWIGPAARGLERQAPGGIHGRKPNIILFLADDMGYGDPECLNPESKIPTPNMNRLAREGMVFTDAHSPSAVCSPTRYGILTGRYCWRTELKAGVLWPWDRPLIEPGRLTLPRLLKQHGYATACIGKWHLGWDWPTKDGSRINDRLKIGQYAPSIRRPFGKKVDFTRSIGGGPTTRGFDYCFGMTAPNFPPYCFIENDRTVGLPTEDKPSNMFGHPGPMLPGWDLTRILPTLTDKAVAFIDRHCQKRPERPFFLYFASTAPHTPIVPDAPYRGKSRAGKYGDFVHQVDASIGRIMNAIRRHGLEQDTIFIVTSDNGSPARNGENASGPIGSVPKQFGHHPSYIYRGIKADIWDGGHRIPLIVRWPNGVEAGSVCPKPVCLTDFMATFAELLGSDLPDDAAEDSFSFLPMLLGEAAGADQDRIIVHHSVNGLFAVRWGPWKLVLGRGSGGWTAPQRYTPKPGEPAGQLYNMRTDPRETTNLYDKHPEIVKDLTQRLDAIRRNGRSR